MKREFPQKVKSVYSHSLDKEALVKFSACKLGLFRQAFPEGNRRVGTSAAMIGLAISMGASSLFLPRQGDRAFAAEPMTVEPSASTAPSSLEKAGLLPITEVAPAHAALVIPEPSVLTGHQVQEEPTLWPLSSISQVDSTRLDLPTPGAYAPSYISSEPVQQAEPELNIHSERSVDEFQTVEPAAVPFEYGDQNRLTLVEPVGAPVKSLAIENPIADDVNELFQAKQEILKANQDVAIKELQQSSSRLRNSLAELRSEESASLSELNMEPAQPSAVASPITNFLYQPGSAKSEAVVSSPEWLPVAPTGSPEAEVAPAIPLIVPAPEAAILPTQFKPVAPAGSSEAAVAPTIPLIVPAPETATAPTRFEPVAPAGSSEAAVAPTVPLIVPAPERTALREQPMVPVASPEGVMPPDLSQAVVIANQGTETVVIASKERKEAKSSIYRVNSGDTIDVIAQNYGLTPSELVDANQLSDPNFINIDQTLKIPVAEADKSVGQTTTLIANVNKNADSGYKTIANTELVPELTAQMQVPNLVMPQSVQASAPTLPIVSSLKPSEATGSLSSSITPNDAVANVAVVPVQQNQSADSQSNHKSDLYVEGLRAEILKLREKYQTQKASNQGNGATTTLVADSIQAGQTPAVRPAGSAPVPARQVNPEFRPSVSRDSLQAGLPQQRQNLQADRSAASLITPTQDTPVVATAPIGADSYDQGIQRRMVSPELPPLAPADRYLPNGAASFNGYIWPAQGEFTSGYGWRWGRMHAGIDVAAPIGTPVVAAAPGVVTYAEWNDGGYGNLVEIQHPDGSLTLYGHNDRILVREGQQVEQGQQIAEMGSTGYSTGPHVHFELHPRGQGAIDPIALLPQ